MRKTGKFLCIMLCITMLLCHIPPVFAEDSQGVIEISSVEAFLAFAEDCRLDSYSQGKVFRLTTDIDLTGTNFDGIPIFAGTFEGANHTVSGFVIQSSGSAKGLFRYVTSGATVRDLRVEGTLTPGGSRSEAGGIVGCNAGVIENCSFSGTVIASEQCGGIAGSNLASGLIKDCAVVGTISAKHFSGGIVGSNHGTIRGCVNQSSVNTTAQQNDIDISDITLGSLTNTESAAATTDIGGIAGYSDGTVIGCVNRGTVGYPHMGYNVGGIVGLQAGYVADCENYGSVSGRKEVGGIVGQQEPEVVVRYDTDTIQILEAQLAVLSDLIDRAAANADANTSKIRNLIHKIERYVSDAEEALDYLRSGLEDPKLEELESYLQALETIGDSMEGVETSLRALWDAIDGTISDLEADIQAISDQMAVIEDTLNHAEDHLGGTVFDDSDGDTDENLTSKVENCRNFASVLGDLNAGGIVGAIAFENDLDPEEDISIVGDTTLNAIGSIRSVIVGCSNAGDVNAKNQRIGGIVGWMALGLVKDCVNTGALDNPSADYVGGIAGHATGFIRNCKVKCVVSGDSYLGGIAGRGTIVTDCYSMVQLSGTEHLGAVLGLAEEAYSNVEVPIQDNFYLRGSVDDGAIDGISYYGKAQGLSQADFFADQADCTVFNQVIISFFADGNMIETVTLPSGSSLNSIPQVPQKDGYVGQWDGLKETDLQNILFDLNIHAVYTAYSVTIQSDLTDDNGRPILLLQGDFIGSSNVTVHQLQAFAALNEGERLIAGCSFSAEHCVNLYAGRLLLTEDVALENLVVMVRDSNGNWGRRAYSVSGSYLVFSLAKGDTAVALVEVPSDGFFTTEVLIAASVGAGIVIVLVLTVFIASRARRKRRIVAAEEVTE